MPDNKWQQDKSFAENLSTLLYILTVENDNNEYRFLFQK